MSSSASLEDPRSGSMDAAGEVGGPSSEKLSDVVIRFAGDSGDGMQLTGTQFSNTSAILGNDLSTLPDFPAEMRDSIFGETARDTFRL